MYKLIDLPYYYNDLEPYIDSETLYIHHDNLHRGYVNNLNKTVKNYPYLYNYTPNELLLNHNYLPHSIKKDTKKYAGGVSNHNLYFLSLTPNKTEISQQLLYKVIKTFNSYENMMCLLQDVLNNTFASMWVFLVLNDCNELEIISLNNQESPFLYNKYPLLALDVWEHSYFLQYKNKKSGYIENVLKIINWDFVNHQYNKYLKI